MLTHVVRDGKGAEGATSAVGPRQGPTSRRVASRNEADACYFRSTAPHGRRKALLKITDRCDLRCAHCFVSATAAGSDMSPVEIATALPRLLAARVSTVTLTGGEPLIHPGLLRILTLLREADLDITVCTNAVALTDQLLDTARDLGRIRFNVSLDGFAASSHGKFRGDRQSFDITLSNTRRLAEKGLLRGILSTPNNLADGGEYEELYGLAADLHAEYLLLNPLSSFGRGIKARARLRADTAAMLDVESRVTARQNGDTEAVFIRFPNTTRPLSSCIAGDLFYVFVNGDVTVCPYLVFATENPGAKYAREDFIVGNLFSDDDIVERLNAYDFQGHHPMGANPTCHGCGHGDACGKGCPAAVVARGGRIGDLDAEVCPIVSTSVDIAPLRRS